MAGGLGKKKKEGKEKRRKKKERNSRPPDLSARLAWRSRLGDPWTAWNDSPGRPRKGRGRRKEKGGEKGRLLTFLIILSFAYLSSIPPAGPGFHGAPHDGEEKSGKEGKGKKEKGRKEKKETPLLSLFCFYAAPNCASCAQEDEKEKGGEKEKKKEKKEYHTTSHTPSPFIRLSPWKAMTAA